MSGVKELLYKDLEEAVVEMDEERAVKTAKRVV